MKTYRIDYTVHSFAFGCDFGFSKNVDGRTPEEAIARFKAGTVNVENVRATELPGRFEADYQKGQRDLDEAERHQ